MSYLTQHPKARWAVPAAAVALVAGASIVTSQAVADDPNLPARSAEQLLVDVQEAEPTPLSGTVVQSSNLGLPAMPGSDSGPRDSTNFSSLLSGTHTLRLWYGSPEKMRMALVGNGGESDLIRNGSDVWHWSSEGQEAIHYTLPENADKKKHLDPSDLPATPEEAAEVVLDRLDPTTAVTTDGTATVAGRDAYELVFTPKASETLVEDVRIAIDAEKSVPLRVQVNSESTDEPAFEVGFSDVDFTAPEARMFEFDAPEGTKVTEGEAKWAELSEKFSDYSKDAKPLAEPDVVGEGWSTVAVFDVADQLDAMTSEKKEGEVGIEQMLKTLPEASGDWGSGRLLQGTLFSAVLTDDGQLALGMVPPEKLYDALA